MTNIKSDAYKKFEEAGNKLKADVHGEAVQKEIAKQEAMDQLAVIHANTELAQMYQESAKIGAENLAGEAPHLRVHSVGKSSKNELANGAEPADGAFFYKPTQQQFQGVTVHILSVSRGFRSPAIEEGKEPTFNQIVGGLIVDGDDYKPFVMYFSGLRLSYLWDFGKTASVFTRAKPMPIPMFALTVNLTTEKIDNKYGKSWIVKFEIDANEDGSPKLITDPGQFAFLRDSANAMQETIKSLIDAVEVRDTQPQAIDGEQVFTDADYKQ